MVHAFRDELEKIALGVGTLQSYLGRRAAQGVGGAAALGTSLAGTAAKTSREAVQGMSGLQKYRLGGVMEGGQAVRKMEQLPNKVGLGPTTQAMRSRVGDALKDEAINGNSRKGGRMMSQKYEGYMTNSRRAYTPEHVGHVMGISPEQARIANRGPTKPMAAGNAGLPGNPQQTGLRISGPPTTGLTPMTQVPGSTPAPISNSAATVPPPGRAKRRGQPVIPANPVPKF